MLVTVWECDRLFVAECGGGLWLAVDDACKLCVKDGDVVADTSAVWDALLEPVSELDIESDNVGWMEADGVCESDFDEERDAVSEIDVLSVTERKKLRLTLLEVSLESVNDLEALAVSELLADAIGDMVGVTDDESDAEAMTVVEAVGDRDPDVVRVKENEKVELTDALANTDGV